MFLSSEGLKSKDSEARIFFKKLYVAESIEVFKCSQDDSSESDIFSFFILNGRKFSLFIFEFNALFFCFETSFSAILYNS